MFTVGRYVLTTRKVLVDRNSPLDAEVRKALWLFLFEDQDEDGKRGVVTALDQCQQPALPDAALVGNYGIQMHLKTS